MKFFIFLGAILFYTTSVRGENVREIEGSIGLISVNFEEIESELDGPNVSEAVSGSYSVIGSSFAYHLFKRKKYSAYVGTILPMLSPQGVGYMSGLVGVEYHFNDVAHMVLEDSPRLHVYIEPKLRYHLNGEVAVNSITYASEDIKKTDISLGVGIGGGGSYTFSPSWGVKLKAMVSKDVGLLTDGMAMKVFIGGIFFLNP